MKFFPLIFLFCVASASLLDIYPNSDEEDFLLKAKEHTQRAEHDLKTELGKKLKAQFELILKHINQTVEEGKDVSRKLIDEAKDLATDLKKYGVRVSDEAIDLLHYLKQRVYNWVKELIDIIRGDNSTAYYSEPKVKTQLAKEMREKFEHIMKRIKKLLEEGNHVSEKIYNEAKDLAIKLKKYGVRVSDEVNDMLDFLEERATRWIDELIEIIRGDNSTVYYSESEVKTELAKTVKKNFEDLMKRIKELVKDGKHVSEEMWGKVKDLAKKLKEYGMNVSDEIHDIFKYLKERGHRWVQELIDIFRGKKEAL